MILALVSSSLRGNNVSIASRTPAYAAGSREAQAVMALSAAPEGSQIRDVSFDSGNGLVISFDAPDTFNLADGTRKAILDYLQALQSSDLSYNGVAFDGYYPLADKSGQVATVEILTLRYSDATIKKNNWDRFPASDIYQVADTGQVDPKFQDK